MPADREDGRRGMTGYKNPSLPRTYRHFFGRDFDGAHDAMADVRACRDVFFAPERVRRRSRRRRSPHDPLRPARRRIPRPPRPLEVLPLEALLRHPGPRRIRRDGNHQRDGPRHGRPHRRPGARTSSRPPSSAAPTTGAATSGRTPWKKGSPTASSSSPRATTTRPAAWATPPASCPIVRQLADVAGALRGQRLLDRPGDRDRVPLPPGHLLARRSRSWPT